MSVVANMERNHYDLLRPHEGNEIAAVFPSPLRRRPDSSLSIVASAEAGVQGSGTGFQLTAGTTIVCPYLQLCPLATI